MIRNCFKEENNLTKKSDCDIKEKGFKKWESMTACHAFFYKRSLKGE